MPRFSEGIILHARQHQKCQLNCVEMHNKNWGSITLAVKAERKCESRTSHIWKSRHNGSAEAELPTFRSSSRVDVWERNFWSLAVKAERKSGIGTSELRYSRQSGSAEVELQIFGSDSRLSISLEEEINIFERIGRVEVWKWNSTSLAVKAKLKCGSRTSDHW